MKRFFAGAALALLCAGPALAQQGVIEATTAGGEKVRLLPDGRWEFVDGQKAAVQRSERAAEVKKQEEVRQAEVKRERGAQGGGVLGIGRTVYEGDKDYNRGTLNPKMR
jgi:opacity protein-like surface antigen